MQDLRTGQQNAGSCKRNAFIPICAASGNGRPVVVMNKILKQGLAFSLISGCGWLMDFTVFVILTAFLKFPVMYANIISSIPAITFVFFTSTRKTFINKSRIKLRYKYLVYFAYQALLLLCISALGGFLYNLLNGAVNTELAITVQCLKISVKIIITPITITLNFIAMKSLIERF
jgi:putative flippase GtrA